MACEFKFQKVKFLAFNTKQKPDRKGGLIWIGIQGALPDGRASARSKLDGDDFHLRINFLFEHALDRHQRAG